MDENRARWDRTIDALETLYKDVERRSLSLPTLSLRPFMACLWNFIKFYVFLILDLYLLLPMNAIIFLRNLFPGRWRYRSFSGSYWKYAITWCWRGEAPAFPFVVIRPLVKLMIDIHARMRFRNIERRIYLDDTITDEDRSQLHRKVRTTLDHWRRPSMSQVVYTYAMPVVGTLTGVVNLVLPRELPDWVGYVGVLLLAYAMTFIVSAFMFKRSLMLGASGPALYFPGAISGSQGYSNEAAILATVGIRQREWPFDIALSFISAAIGFVFKLPLEILFPHFSTLIDILIGVYLGFLSGFKRGYSEARGLPVPSDNVGGQEIVAFWTLVTIFIILNLLALYRRRKTGRF